MIPETKRIRIEPESELGRLLDEAGDTPVILEKDGELYRLTKEEAAKPRRRAKTKADYEAFLSAAGGWKDFDLDTFLKHNYESRNIQTRPPVEL